jgi:hypothetical protein
MGLSNAASRARNYNQSNNRNQGGGDKKAGFPYQVGRSAWSSIFIDNLSLSSVRLTNNPRVRQSRPMGSAVNVPYWSR